MVLFPDASPSAPADASAPIPTTEEGSEATQVPRASVWSRANSSSRRRLRGRGPCGHRPARPAQCRQRCRVQREAYPRALPYPVVLLNVEGKTDDLALHKVAGENARLLAVGLDRFGGADSLPGLHADQMDHFPRGALGGVSIDAAGDHLGPGGGGREGLGRKAEHYDS